MAQRKSPAAPGRGAVLERVGPYALDALLRRDRLGEVYAATGPDGAVRVRICPPRDDPAPLSAAIERLAATPHPALAPVLDHLVDDEGRVAVVGPLAPSTLADRRRRGRLDASTIGALGCVLLDGLAALHAAGMSHAAVSPAAVAIGSDGAAWWEDAGLLPALTGSRMAQATRAALDVTEGAAMLRELGRLPTELEAVVDPVASGVPGAIERAGPLAAAWREALAALAQPAPPAGVRARIPGLLAPEPKPRRQRVARAPRRPPPRWLRVGGAVALVAAALAVVPVAALTPGGRPLADRIDAYTPLRRGLQLTYRLSTQTLDATVVLRVSDARVIAGDLTITLESQSSLTGGGAALPLGLGGATVRVHGDSLVRTVAGGAVRDLVLPFVPGASWRDQRAGPEVEQSVVEQRTLLGPTRLRVPGGSFDRCLAVTLRSATILVGGVGATGVGTLWYCPGVGLARAHLEANGMPLDIELVSVH
jgi:hypothetical protein